MGLFEAGFFGEWVYETTEATVAVTTDTPFLGEGCNFRSGIKVSVGEVRCTGHEHNRITVDLSFPSFHVGLEVLCELDLSELDLEVESSFIEGGMGRVVHDHVRKLHTPLSCLLSVGKAGQQDALGAS